MREALLLIFASVFLLARYNSTYADSDRHFQQFSPHLAPSIQHADRETHLSILVRYIVKSLKETLGLAVENYRQVLEKTRDDVTEMNERSWDLQQFGIKIDNLLANMETTEVGVRTLSERLLQLMLFPLEYMVSADTTFITMLNKNGLTQAAVRFLEYRDTFVEKFTAAVDKYINSFSKEERIRKQNLIAAFEIIKESKSKNPFPEIKDFVNKFLRPNA